MSHEGGPSVSRQFDIAQKLGELEGSIQHLGENLAATTGSLSDRFEKLLVNTFQPEGGVPCFQSVTMTTKNKITFSGKATECVDNFCDQLGYLSIANKYTDEQKYAQTLLSLKGPALQWFKGQDETTFKGADGKLSPKLLHVALKARFKPDKRPGDLMMKIMDDKMRPTETVDQYLDRILPLFEWLDMDESLQAGLLQNGFLPYIRNELKIKGDLNTIAEVERFARRVQDMKPDLVRPMNVPEPPHEINQTLNNPKPVACFKCSGPHYIRDCPYNFQNVHASNIRGNGRGRFNFPGQYVQSMQRPRFPQQFSRGVFHHRPRIQNTGQYGGYRPPFRPRGFVNRGSHFRHPHQPNWYSGPRHFQPRHQVNMAYDDTQHVNVIDSLQGLNVNETDNCYPGMSDSFGMYDESHSMHNGSQDVFYPSHGMSNTSDTFSDPSYAMYSQYDGCEYQPGPEHPAQVPSSNVGTSQKNL